MFFKVKSILVVLKKIARLIFAYLGGMASCAFTANIVNLNVKSIKVQTLAAAVDELNVVLVYNLHAGTTY